MSLPRVFQKINLRRLWQQSREQVALKGARLVEKALTVPTSETPRKFGVFFYDDRLNIVEKEHAVYELHFHTAALLEWKLVQGTPEDTAHFFIASYTVEWGEEDWAKFPFNVASGLIKTLANDPHNQCGFAFQWINNDERGRYRMFLSTHRGSLDECEKIYTWLAYTFAPPDHLWRQASWAIKIKHDNDAFPNVTLWSHIKRDCTLLFDNNPAEFTDRQFKLTRLVHCYFMPFYFEKARRQHLRVHQAGKTGDIEWHFKVPSPTYHERLEARLQLRDWLQGKVAPEEIPFLLGESQ